MRMNMALYTLLKCMRDDTYIHVNFSIEYTKYPST